MHHQTCLSHLLSIKLIKENKITLHSSLESERDYIHIDDVVKLIPDIIHKGKENIYNIASGRNIKNKEIVDEISKMTGCEIEVEENSPIYSSPNISIDKIKSEFQFSASSIQYDARVISLDGSSIEDIIKLGKSKGLSYLVVDNLNDKPNRKSFFNDLFYHEEKYPYLVKNFDSKEHGYNYQVKIFKIDYEKFEALNLKS